MNTALETAAVFAGNISCGLEGAVAYLIRDHDKHKCSRDKAEICFPRKLDPLSVVHAAQGQLGNGAGGPESVRKPVAVLVREHHYLLIDAEDLAEGAHDRHHHHGLAGAGSHEEVEQGDEQVDDKQGDEPVGIAEQAGHAVDKGIDDVAGGEQHGNGAGQADNDGGTDYVLHALYEVAASLVGLHLEHDNGNYDNGEVQRRDFRHAPAPVERAHYGEGNAGNEDDQGYYALGVELKALLHGEGSDLFFTVVGAHYALGGILFYLAAIADNEEQADHIKHHKTYAAESKAGVHRQADKGLADAGGVGVNKTAGEAYGAGQHDYGSTNHSVVAKAHEYGYYYGIERIQTVEIADNAHCGEYCVEKYDYYYVLTLRPADHALYTCGEGTGGIEDLDAAGYQQNGSDDAGAVHKALVDGGEELHYIRFRADSEASSKAIYEAYTRWCDDNAQKPMSANRVSSELAQNERLYNVEATNNVHVGGKRVRGFMGIEVVNPPPY